MPSQGKRKGESQGLHFLKKVRPEAISHLLSFFGESGRHLDPRTRALISVVTKVIGASHRGVEQYVRKALEAGASADEIIDAVLCSYPCAGLTRVVDAIDVILDMRLPAFEKHAAAASISSPGAEEAHGKSGPGSLAGAAPAPAQRTDAAAGGWLPAADLDGIPPGSARRVDVGLHSVALFNLDGKIHAAGDCCPHQGGSLSEGTVTEGEVICPLHCWQFDLATGECSNRPQVAIPIYPVKVEGGKVFIQLKLT